MHSDSSRLHDAALVNNDARLRQVFNRLAAHSPVLVVVGQPASTRAVPVAVGLRGRLPIGLATRREAGLHPGNAKTDARDAYVIAHPAGCAASTSLAELEVLAGFDDDLAGEATSITNPRSH